MTGNEENQMFIGSTLIEDITTNEHGQHQIDLFESGLIYTLIGR